MGLFNVNDKQIAPWGSREFAKLDLPVFCGSKRKKRQQTNVSEQKTRLLNDLIV
jgi:hypothetical protein